MIDVSRGIGLALHQEGRGVIGGCIPEKNHLRHTPLSKPFHPEGADRMFPPVLLEDLKNQHDAFFNNTSRSVPTPKRKTDWKETLKRHFESSLSEIVQSARKALHNDNFQRTVHIEVEVPGVGNITRYANVFFDIYCRTDLIGGKCAARFGIISTVDAAHLMMPARWYVEEDGNLKEPRLHFNPRYEVGEFQYAEFLNGIDLVIGWDTIQKLKLLDPKDGLVAAGLGFRQLAPSVDEAAARRNHPAVVENRNREWERMQQHMEEKKAREAAAAAVAEAAAAAAEAAAARRT